MPGTAVKMIALDLDGTLLGTDGQVSERNIAALREDGVADVIARHLHLSSEPELVLTEAGSQGALRD